MVEAQQQVGALRKELEASQREARGLLGKANAQAKELREASGRAAALQPRVDELEAQLVRQAKAASKAGYEQIKAAAEQVRGWLRRQCDVQ